MEQPNLKIYIPETENTLELPIASSSVAAGFPSPAQDYTEGTLDLNRLLVRHPAATFFVRVEGESMQGDGINHGDLLVVDRSLEPRSGVVAVCYLDGEFTLKRLLVDGGKIMLMPSNEKFKPIEVSPDNDFTVWGIVTHSIKKH